jgi:hypothetical protein
MHFCAQAEKSAVDLVPDICADLIVAKATDMPERIEVVPNRFAVV